ncbi:MAG: GNAT family N-acetyltransferase [Dactylosporangium sp.]|nr:GNAT family N-acetyltransferase [Dactylosporangium sp.]NNJ63583.1 GNAT family N-acetyltransferase [Dactylosporangium sp.]
MRLVHWCAADLLHHMDDVLDVYGEAMGYSPDLLQTRRGYIASHVNRASFTAVATLDDAGRLLGFGYGYRSRPGQWWHDQVRNAVRRDERHHWLADCFEVVELHVRPAAQGRGVGGRQLTALFAPTVESRTLLSTPEADESTSRAWRLYRRFGFVDVLRHFRFPGDNRPFAVLGRQLPLST